MGIDASAYQTNIVRRGIGVVIASLPFVIVSASLLRAVTDGSRASTIGLIITTLGTAFAAGNFYLSFVRRFVVPGGAHVSVIPFIGTLVIFVGTAIGFRCSICAGLGLVGALVDTGGPVWFLVVTWKDKSFWDTPIDRNA